MKQMFGSYEKQKGFTLIEIISVLIIIGIVSAVVIVRMTSPSIYDLASRVEAVKNHIRLAQSRAMSSNSSCGINFTSSTTYNMFKIKPDKTTELVHMLGEENDTVDLAAGDRKSVLTITPPADGGNVTFNKFGSPVDTSGKLLTSNITLATSGGNITITKNTGFIP